MECEHVREEFVERLTGSLPADRSSAIDDHLASCTECWAETARLRDLWNELGTLRAPSGTGSVGRIERLIDARGQGSALPAPLPYPISRATRITAATIGIAALVLVGVVVGRRTTADRAAPAVAGVAVPKERYVLLLHGPARTAPASAAQAAADSVADQALVSEYRAWAGGLRNSGSLVLGEKLADDPVTLLAASGETQLPHNTADELGGFFLIQVADSAEAFRIARDCPHLRHGGTIQVRKIEPT